MNGINQVDMQLCCSTSCSFSYVVFLAFFVLIKCLQKNRIWYTLRRYSSHIAVKMILYLLHLYSNAIKYKVNIY